MAQAARGWAGQRANTPQVGRAAGALGSEGGRDSVLRAGAVPGRSEGQKIRPALQGAGGVGWWLEGHLSSSLMGQGRGVRGPLWGQEVSRA